MKRISSFEDREVVGTDGNLLGWVRGFTFPAVGDWRVTGVALKMEKESHEELGVKKPFMSGALVDVNVEDVKNVSDNILLKMPQRGMKGRLKAHQQGKNISNIIDKAVIDSDGKDIGTVADVMVDTEGWMFPSILIRLTKEVLEFLKMEKCPDCERNVLLPMGNVGNIGDNVMLNIDKEALGDLVQKAPVKTM
jgi:sporulation protein YlmC with PRC-barrel domain